MPDSQRT